MTLVILVSKCVFSTVRHKCQIILFFGNQLPLMASTVAIMVLYKYHSYEFKLNKVHTYLYIYMKVTKLKEPKLMEIQ